MLCLKCEGQALSFSAHEKIADGFVNVNVVQFSFCERWSGMVKTAQFTQRVNGERKTYNVLIDDLAGTAAMPNEVVAGDLLISAFGVDPDTGMRITTTIAVIKVEPSGFTPDGDTPIPPTPDLYAQLIATIHKTALPHIGDNGNWWFDDEDTGVSALGDVIAARNEAVAAVEAKGAATLASIPADYTETANLASQLKDTKADAVIDTSARAASHELHAQRGRLAVTMYGKTTETGTGDKSPDNPYTISGVDVARVHCGSANVLHITNVVNKTYLTLNANGTISAAFSGVSAEMYSQVHHDPVIILPGMKLVCTNATGTRYLVGLHKTDGSYIIHQQIAAGATATIDLSAYAGETISYSHIYFDAGSTHNGLITLQLRFDGGTDYEPYCANVITPPLLPDGAPLHGNGTVDDTVENDVLSGCDKSMTLTALPNANAFNSGSWSTHAIVYDTTVAPDIQPNTVPYCEILPGQVGAGSYTKEYISTNATINGFFYMSISFERLGIAKTTDMTVVKNAINAYLAANPLTVYYRSTDYAPANDLRVCRTVRKWAYLEFDGSEAWVSTASGGYTFYYVNTGVNVTNQHRPNTSHEPTAKVVFVNNGQIRLYDTTNFPALADWTAWLAEQAAGTPFTVLAPLATPETYVTDPVILRKPDTLTTETTTVTGSGETAVEYPHTTKHYIDSQIAAAVALALNS